MEEKCLKVIVVDDEIDTEELYSILFKNEIRDGVFRFTFFNSAEEAIKDFNHDDLPDVVLVDYNMPGMDGPDLIEGLKKKYFHIPMGIMTSFTDVERKKIGKEKGADFFLEKTFDINSFRKNILNLLSYCPH